MKIGMTRCFLGVCLLVLMACGGDGKEQLALIVKNPPIVNINNIEIVRDSFGVPHIFTRTDKEVVYGIAWAQCEDNFNLMQEKLYISKGLSGRMKGKDAAALDYIEI